MPKYRVPVRLYWTADKTRVVPEGDPEAAFLFAPAGRLVLEVEAIRLGLIPADGANEAVDVPVDVITGAEYAGVVMEEVTPGEVPLAQPGPATHVCPHCDRVCRTAIGLKSHVSSKHPDS